MKILDKKFLYPISYSFVMAFSVLWIDKLGDIFVTSTMLGFVAIFATVFYNAINLKNIVRSHISIFQNFKDWFLMSFSFAMTWLFTYYSVIYGSPRLSLISYYLILPIITSLFSKIYIRAFIFVLLLSLCYVFFPESNYTNIPIFILCGIFGYLYMKFSEIYANSSKLSATSVLSTRFYILIITSFILCSICHNYDIMIETSNTSLNNEIIMLLVLACFNLLPNYIAQKGIIISGANNFAKIISFTPMVIFVLQGFVLMEWDVMSLILCLVSSFFLITMINAPSNHSSAKVT